MFRRRRRLQKLGTSADIVSITSRPCVVAALPLKRAARDHLARQLGDVDVCDIRDDVFDADLVLAPSCSPQVIGILKRAYPTARLVVVELEDWELDVRLGGPVKRLLNAGADAYLTADSIKDLADQLLRPANDLSHSKTSSLPKQLGKTSVDDQIMASVADLLRRRAQASHGA